MEAKSPRQNRPSGKGSAARDIALALLTARRPGATICPSEVARALASTTHGRTADGDWRTLMPVVHEAIDGLVSDEQVQLSWKRQKLAARIGPYRIAWHEARHGATSA
jgi:hypothetical protein